MKKVIAVFVIASLTQQIVSAQGTLYLSSLSTNATGALSVGSDYWLAAGFGTGTNATGYVLDSVQLGMDNGSGNPNGFTVMIYSATALLGVNPASSLGTLNGSLNPTSTGIYIYTPTSSLTLLPRTDYFIVLTAGTAVANGAYEWSESAYPPTYSIDSWGGVNGVYYSSDGTSWQSTTPYSGIAQFAITATAIPEPGVSGLLGLGGLSLLWHRRSAKVV